MKLLLLAAIVLVLLPERFSTEVPSAVTQDSTVHKNNDRPNDAQDQVYSNKNSTELDETDPRNMSGLKLSQISKTSDDAGVGNTSLYIRLYYFIFLHPNVSGNASKGQNIDYNNKYTLGNVLNKDDLNRHKGLVKDGGFDVTKVLNKKVSSTGPNILPIWWPILPEDIRFKDDSAVKEDALQSKWKEKYLETIESQRKLPHVLKYNRNYFETSKLNDKAFEFREEKSFVSKPKTESNEEKASYANLHENQSKVENDVKTLLKMIFLLNKMKHTFGSNKENLEDLQQHGKDHKNIQPPSINQHNANYYKYHVEPSGEYADAIKTKNTSQLPSINHHNATYYKYHVEPSGEYADGIKTKNTHDLRTSKRAKRNVWFRTNDRSGIHSEMKWSGSSTKHKRQVQTHLEAKGKDHGSSNLKNETRAEIPLSTSYKGAVIEKPSINSTVREQISAKETLDRNSKGDDTLTEPPNSDPKRNSTLVEMPIKNPTKEGSALEKTLHKNPMKEGSSHEKTPDGPKGNATPVEIQTNKNVTKEGSSYEKTTDGPKGNGTPVEIQTNRNPTKEGYSHEKTSNGPKGNGTLVEIQTSKNSTKEGSSHEKTLDGPKGNGTSDEIQTKEGPSHEKTSDGPKGNGTLVESISNKNPTKVESLQEKINNNTKKNITSSEKPNKSDEWKLDNSHLVKNATAFANQFHFPVKHEVNSMRDVKDKNAPLNSHLNNSNSSSQTQMINVTNTMDAKMPHGKQKENTTEGIRIFENFPQNTTTDIQIVTGNMNSQSIVEGKSTEVMSSEAVNHARKTENHHQMTKPIQTVHNGSLNRTSHVNNTLSNHTNDNLSSKSRIFRRQISFTKFKLDDQVPSVEMGTIIPDKTNHTDNHSVVNEKVGEGIDQVNKNQKLNVTGTDDTQADNAGKIGETEIANRSTINNNEEITSLDDLKYDAKMNFQVQLYNLMTNFMKITNNDTFINEMKIANQTNSNENNGRNAPDDNVRDATNMKIQTPLHQMVMKEIPKFNDSMGDQITINISSISDSKNLDNSTFNANAENIFTFSNSNGTLKQGTLNETTTEQSQVYKSTTTDRPTVTEMDSGPTNNQSADNQQNSKNHRLKRQNLFMPKQIPDIDGSSIAETKVANQRILHDDGKNSKENTMTTKQMHTPNETLLDGTVKASHTRQNNNADLSLTEDKNNATTHLKGITSMATNSTEQKQNNNADLSLSAGEEKNATTHLKEITSMATNSTEQRDFMIRQLLTNSENNTKETGTIQHNVENKALVADNSTDTSNLKLHNRMAAYDANRTVLESSSHVITDKNPLAFSHGKHNATDAAIKQNSHEMVTEPNENLTSEVIIQPLILNTHLKHNKRAKRFRQKLSERNLKILQYMF